MLQGSTAIAFVRGDAVLAAKNLDEVAKKFPALVVKGGILGGKILDAGQAKALASVASREVLLAQLAGMLISPVQKMGSLLYAPLGNLGNALYALQQQQESAAPEESAPAEAAPEASAPAEAAADARSENPTSKDSSGEAETQA